MLIEGQSWKVKGQYWKLRDNKVCPMDNLVNSLKSLEIIGSTDATLEQLGLQYKLIDDNDLLSDFLKDLECIPEDKWLNVDFEGVDLCKTGIVCLGQVHISGSKIIYILDFIKIPNLMTFERNGKCLKSIFESSITKVFFDPRNDIDAIAHQFDTIPKNVLCLQICEIAKRKTDGVGLIRFVFGLKKTFEKYLQISNAKKTIITRLKSQGHLLFDPNSGGSYQVFKDRPLKPEIIQYCAIDVAYFDDLKTILYDGLPNYMKKNVLNACDARVKECLSPGYKPHGKQKACAKAVLKDLNRK